MILEYEVLFRFAGKLKKDLLARAYWGSQARTDVACQCSSSDQFFK